MLWVFLAVLILRECFKILTYRKKYFLNLKSWIDLCLIGLTFSIFFTGSYSRHTREQLSAIAVLLAAFELFLMLGQHQQICTSVLMLRNVAYHVLQFTLLFSILIFAFTFYLIFNKYLEITASENGTVTPEYPSFSVILDCRFLKLSSC